MSTMEQMTEEQRAEHRRRLAMWDRLTVTPDSPPKAAPWREDEAAAVRTLALAVRDALGGSDWTAESRSPYWPCENETHGQTIIAVDRRWLVVATHTIPVRTVHDMFTIKINGRPIPYRSLRGDLPHQPGTIAANIWRHVNGVTVEPCDSLTCQHAPTVAIFGGSLCEKHARRYAETGQV